MIRFRNHSEIQEAVDVEKKKQKCFKFMEAGISVGDTWIASGFLHSDSI